MTPAQRLALTQLQGQGFHLVVESRDLVRVTRHGDSRVIQADGTQKRGHHGERGQPPVRPSRPSR